jgi:hypothetical protein
MDLNKIARAIEGDAGEPLPDLHQALDEARSRLGRVTTPEQILVRKAREASGLTQAAFAERILASRHQSHPYVIGRRGDLHRPAACCVCYASLQVTRT